MFFILRKELQWEKKKTFDVQYFTCLFLFGKFCSSSEFSLFFVDVWVLSVDRILLRRFFVWRNRAETIAIDDDIFSSEVALGFAWTNL